MLSIIKVLVNAFCLFLYKTKFNSVYKMFRALVQE